MGVTKVKLINYKKHKDFEFNFDNKTALIIGDSGEGKSSILEVIAASFMRREYPENPLTHGEEDGRTEVTYKDQSGLQYTIKRKFDKRADKRLNRFVVVDENGGKHTLSDLLGKIYGVAFKNAHFDYETYFYEQKTTAARFKYAIQAIGGDEVYSKRAEIKKIIAERQAIGSQRLAQKNLWEQTGTLDPDTLETNMAYYENEKDFKEASNLRTEYLNANLINIEHLEIDYIRSKDHETALYTLKEAKNEKLEKIAELEKALVLLKEDIVQIDIQIEDLLAIDELIPEKNITKSSDEIKDEITKAKDKNEIIRIEADQLYDQEIKQVILFNTEREKFLSAVESLNEYLRLDEEWKELDEKISKLETECIEIFKKRLPIDSLTIETNSEGEDYIAWNGRELNSENLSKGETIQITAEIQAALNPGGDNFILIQEAQSMGSKLDEVLSECSNFGIQAIVEYTQRDEKLHIEFQEVEKIQKQRKK